MWHKHKLFFKQNLRKYSKYRCQIEEPENYIAHKVGELVFKPSVSRHVGSHKVSAAFEWMHYYFSKLLWILTPRQLVVVEQIGKVFGYEWLMQNLFKILQSLFNILHFYVVQKQLSRIEIAAFKLHSKRHFGRYYAKLLRVKVDSDQMKVFHHRNKHILFQLRLISALNETYKKARILIPHILHLNIRIYPFFHVGFFQFGKLNLGIL